MPEKLEPEFTGDVVDYRIDTDDEGYILSLQNGKEIVEVLKKLIGRYRHDRKGRETKPSTSNTINHLKSTIKHINNIDESLELIPQDALAELELLSNQRVKQLFFLRSKYVREELEQFTFLINNVIGTLEQQPDKKGEKPKTYENRLLANTAMLFEQHAGFGVIKAAETAATILNNNTKPISIHKSNFPKNPSEARRTVKSTIDTYRLDCPKLE